VILLGCRHPKDYQQVVAYQRLECPPVLPDDGLGEGVEAREPAIPEFRNLVRIHRRASIRRTA
jgi:hypothetical protein